MLGCTQARQKAHLDHLLNNVDTGGHLGDRVLDLQARVHLQEVKVALLVDQELDGACYRNTETNENRNARLALASATGGAPVRSRTGRVVLDRLGELDSLVAHGLSRLGVQVEARCLLNDLQRADSAGVKESWAVSNMVHEFPRIASACAPGCTFWLRRWMEHSRSFK